VAVASRYARVPYTVGLVVAGLGISLIARHPPLVLTPNLVMLVFLPPLLFAGAWTYPRGELPRHWLLIGLLATIGVLVCMYVAWFVLVRAAGVSAHSALVFGAMIAATDPVAVLSVFRSLNTNRHLAAIVEAESLFNDATAVVAFGLALAATGSESSILSFHSVLQFAQLLAVGALVGLAVGFAGLLVLRFTDDYVVEAMGTLIVAYGSYYVANMLGASGLIAVIVAAMLAARVGTRLGSFTATRQSVNQLWEFIAFVANSLLFLLVGLSINLSEEVSTLRIAGWAIAAVVLARIIAVYGLSAASGAFGRPIPAGWQHVLALGGLRGALSMALALSLPAGYPDRALLVSVVFSVVLFTIIGQGLTLAPAIVGLHLENPLPDS
jgi:CPA1 family monovalent cation:H+ antiporter